KIRVAETIADVEKLRGSWAEAIATSPHTIFQDFDWNLLALRIFSDEHPFFVVAGTTSSIAILPLVIRDHSLRLAGGPLFDYRDAICAGDDSAFVAALDVAGCRDLPF